MLSPTLRDATNPSCPTSIAPAPALTDKISVPPFFTVPLSRWDKEKGVNIQLNFDHKALFPKLKNVCRTTLVQILTTTVNDHSTSTGAPTRPAEICVTTRKLSGYKTVLGIKIPQYVNVTDCRTGAVADPSSCPEHAFHLRADGTPDVPNDIAAWAQNAVAQSAKLIPTMMAAGYTEAQAMSGSTTLAEAVISHEALLRAMWKRSYAFAYNEPSANLVALYAPNPAFANNPTALKNRSLFWGTSPSAVPPTSMGQNMGAPWALAGRAGPKSTTDNVKVYKTDFVQTYRGINNPFIKPADRALVPGMFKPVFDGKIWLWGDIASPFTSDFSNWALFAEWKGGATFRIRIERVDESVGGKILGALKLVVTKLCSIISRPELQMVSNVGASAPVPAVQAVVRGWQAAAAACGMAFPPPNATCGPVDIAPETKTEVSAWDAYGKYVAAGAVGLAALVVVKRLRDRGRVSA